MGDVRNLTGDEAIKKVKIIGKDIKVCMFCTYENGKLVSRPMSVNKIDEEGNLWFLSAKNSNKNRQIVAANLVNLVFSEGTEKFMNLRGHAVEATSKSKIQELWTPIAKIWFTNGVDDPNISCIKFSFSDGYYWDTKHGKVVEAVKMATALAIGKTMDDGIEGSLHR